MIIFMGVAGSGKSSQGRALADELGLPWVSTGEFLRMLVSGDRRKDMVAGKLLGDQEIIKLVQRILTIVDTSTDFVLDGFPRTPAQADWLLSQVRHGQLDVSAVVHLKASPEVVTKRLYARGRPDDSKSGIAKRFKEYEQAVKPILKEFKDAKIPVHEINADRNIDTVHADILKAITS